MGLKFAIELILAILNWKKPGSNSPTGCWQKLDPV
jgi:hypothetical protein